MRSTTRSITLELFTIGFSLVVLTGGGCPDPIPDPIPVDNCPSDPNKFDPGICGCGTPDTDSDGDGTPDCYDDCPNDPNKTAPGICGCGVSDADTDAYGLYNTSMSSNAYGCKIERTGSSPDYSYSVAGDRADRPVGYVSWGDAARFSNWLHNGRPTGAQDLSTTEDGSYFLNGAMTDAELIAIRREPGATWVIPSEDEWYKAAYYDGGSGVYNVYPTGTGYGEWPSNDLIDPDPGNNATFARCCPSDYTIGSPYWRTEVGAHENSGSPYGTFDQGGNVSEWNEAVHAAWYRGVRGGGFFGDSGNMRSSFAYLRFPVSTYELYSYGFRVAEVP